MRMPKSETKPQVLVDDIDNSQGESNGSPDRRKLMEILYKPGDIDTAAPFESVKEAINKFGGIVNREAQNSAVTMESCKHVQLELDKTQEEIAKYRRQYEAAEAIKKQVLKELNSVKTSEEDLKLSLERAEIQEKQAIEDCELAALRLKETEQGIATSASAAAKAQLEVAKERYATAVTDLRSVKQQMELMRGKHASLVHERGIALSKAKELISASIEIEKHIEVLTLELITTKELLGLTLSTQLEAEEQRTGAALALEQDKFNWENELKQAEDELQQLSEELQPTNDLKPKLDNASASLFNLNAERASYKEAKLNQEVKYTQEDELVDHIGEEKETHTRILKALTTSTKELEEAKTNIEKANNEVNYLSAAVSSLKSKLEMERASLSTMRQRDGLASVSVSTLEAELKKIQAKIELILEREEKAELDHLIGLPRASGKIFDEGNQAKLVAKLARRDIRKAKKEAEQAKAGADAMERRLSATLKEIEAAEAAEKLAYSTIKAMEEGDSTNRVTLSIQQYLELSKKANEAEELAKKRVVSAVEQIVEARDLESRTLQELEEVNKMIEERKKALSAAVAKAEKEKQGKKEMEQELRTWRAQQAHQRRSSLLCDAGCESGSEGDSDLDESPTPTMPELSMVVRRSNTTNSINGSRRKKKSFFWRIAMFWTRKTTKDHQH